MIMWIDFLLETLVLAQVVIIKHSMKQKHGVLQIQPVQESLNGIIIIMLISKIDKIFKEISLISSIEKRFSYSNKAIFGLPMRRKLTLYTIVLMMIPASKVFILSLKCSIAVHIPTNPAIIEATIHDSIGPNCMEASAA